MKFIDEKRAEAAFRHATENTLSDFYRKKYEKAGVQLDTPFSPDFFFSLPMLTRQEVIDTPLAKRTFVPPEKVVLFSYTSGTTTNMPLVIPMSDIVTPYIGSYFDPSFGTDAQKILVVCPPINKRLHWVFTEQCRYLSPPKTAVFGDYQNLINSAFLAGITECDGIYATPTIALLLLPQLKRFYDPKKIKILGLVGEVLTKSQRELLAIGYPNAKIANHYGSSEAAQPILVPCKNIIDEGKNEFHLLESLITAAELVDGELVLTYAVNEAMPLIRYRTGDYFTALPEPCGCGIKSPRLAWAYRDLVDRMRVGGVDFRVEETDRLFSSLLSIPPCEYQIHFYSPKTPERKIRIVVEIKHPREHSPDKTAYEHIAREIESKWILAAGATMKDAVEKKLFEPVEISFVEKFSAESVKKKRFVSHLE